jgi:hypothetical protein
MQATGVNVPSHVRLTLTAQPYAKRSTLHTMTRLRPSNAHSAHHAIAAHLFPRGVLCCAGWRHQRLAKLSCALLQQLRVLGVLACREDSSRCAVKTVCSAV